MLSRTEIIFQRKSDIVGFCQFLDRIVSRIDATLQFSELLSLVSIRLCAVIVAPYLITDFDVPTRVRDPSYLLAPR